jgi:hypothetical protein
MINTILVELNFAGTKLVSILAYLSFDCDIMVDVVLYFLCGLCMVDVELSFLVIYGDLVYVVYGDLVIYVVYDDLVIYVVYGDLVPNDGCIFFASFDLFSGI